MKKPIQYFLVVGALMIAAPFIQLRVSMFGDPTEVTTYTLRTMCLSTAFMALAVALIWTGTLHLLKNPPRWLFWSFMLVATWLMTRVLFGEFPAVVAFMLAFRDRGRFFGPARAHEEAVLGEQALVP
jgi:hypothetical protein